jgi:hypothetical protein
MDLVFYSLAKGKLLRSKAILSGQGFLWWYEGDAFAASVAAIDVAGQPDNQPDKTKENSTTIPRNQDVCRLIHKANQAENRNRALIDIAREIVENSEPKAQSLVRQARRFPHLLDRADR